MNLTKINTIYFVGIGGIGMSALARHFFRQGKQILGYDRTTSNITKALQDEGISIFFDNDHRPIQKLKVENTLVVYTPAVTTTQSDLVYFRKNGFQIVKRSEVLGAISAEPHCIAIAGTHGKTTISAILAHLLKTANASMTAFLGGISNNYNTNYIYNGDEIIVVEADEFDKSFLQLHPDIICISSMDADHLDIYANHTYLKENFKLFAEKIPANQRIIKTNLPLEGFSYDIGDRVDSDYKGYNVRLLDNGYVQFDLQTPQGIYRDVVFSGYGQHNLSNAIAAFATASLLNISPNILLRGLSTFEGVKRRFSHHIRRPDLVYIDDYAHHPTEITAVYDALKLHYPNKKIMAIFQPHLYSRTRDFMNDFAKSLSQFDIVILLDIYPARELPIAGINSTVLLERISCTNKHIIDKKSLVDIVTKYHPEVLLTIGAGDIGEEVDSLTKALSL